jgi:isopentenyldiphosphate isomerase
MSDSEILDIVNEKDEIIGQDTKKNKFEKELISRNVAVFLRDSLGMFIIMKRSESKKSYPGRLDAAACGNVMAGESYEEAAKRELKEELNVECELRLLWKVYNEFNENGKLLRYHTAVFEGTWDGAISPNEETQGFQKMTLDELSAMVKKRPEMFTPGFVADFLQIEKLL